MNSQLSESAALSSRSLVLLVNEDWKTLDAYGRYFEANGLSVATATAPAEGRAHARDLRPDLLITDLRFGGEQSGVDLLRTLKADSVTVDIPIVLLSATEAAVLPLDTRRQADAILIKPVLPDLLLSQAETLIARSAALRTRSNSALERARALIEKRIDLNRRLVIEILSKRERPCPQCGALLEWVERSAVAGAEYDHYRACDAGCGRYSYDWRARLWIKLE